MRITICKNIVRGAAKDNIVNISRGPWHCQCKKYCLEAKPRTIFFYIGNAEARVIYSYMNTEAKGILMVI